MSELKQVKGYGFSVNNRYIREDRVVLPDGMVVEQGDLFKVRGKNRFGVGEWGIVFKFTHLVTDTKTGNTYVECYEMYRGRAGVMRAFPVDRIKRIPKKRVKKVKNVIN